MGIGGNAFHGTRWAGIIATAALFVLTPLFFLPAQVYYLNASEFAGTFLELEAPVLITSTILGALLVFFLGISRDDRYTRRLSLLLAVGFLFWLQGNVLLGDHGVLDGRPIRWWQDNPGLAFFEVLLWPAVMIAAWRWHDAIASKAFVVAIVLLAVQSVALVIAVQRSSESPQAPRFSLDESHKYAFSTNRNVVLVVLDGFQSDVFAEVLEGNPAYADSLDGFVYYRNALAGFSKTYPSIPLLLTGVPYRNEKPIGEFTREVYRESAVTRSLLEADWRVDVFPLARITIPPSPDVASNFVDDVFGHERLRSTGELLDIALLRVLPHFLKETWVRDGRWRLRRYLPKWAGYRVHETHAELQFLEEFETRATASLTEPAFKFYHLNIPHAPFMLNRQLQLENLPDGRPGYVEQSVAAVELLTRLVDALKREGLYENTQLIVVADHGGGEYWTGVSAFDMDNGGQAPQDSCAARPTGFEHASGLPLFLVKPIGNSGPLQVSDAPVHLGDVAATIAAGAALPPHSEGRAVSDVATGEPRQRHYYFYEFAGWEKSYLPALKEFVVDGHSWQASAWCATGRQLEPAGAAEYEEPPVTLPLGLSIRFVGEYSAHGWLKEGWSIPEPDAGRIWSKASRAVLEIPVHPSWPEEVILEFDIDAFTVPGKLPAQRVIVSVDNRVSAEWKVGGRALQQLRLSRSQGREVVRIEFALPDATSPASLLLSQDVRRLGIALHGLSVRLPD